MSFMSRKSGAEGLTQIKRSQAEMRKTGAAGRRPAAN